MRTTFRLFLLCTFLFIGSIARAALIVASGGEWTDGTSWVGGVPPVSGVDDVYIPAGVTITITDTGLFTPLNYNGNISIDGTLGLVSSLFNASGLSMDGSSSISIGIGGEITSTYVPFFGSPDPNYITMGFLNVVYNPTLGDPNPATGPAVVTPGGTTTLDVLYSIASNDWNTNGTWSDSRGGASCGCTPTSSDYVVIDNHTVTIGSAGDAGGLTIESGSTLNWTAATTLTLSSGGALDVESGGTLSENGQTDAIISMSGSTISQINNDGSFSIYRLNLDAGTPTLITNNSTFSILQHLDINATSNVHIQGGSDIDVTLHIRMDAANTFVFNNLTADLNIRDVFFNNDGSAFTNNGSLTARDIRVQAASDDNNIFINNGTVDLSRNINTRDADFTLQNNGTINQSGEFVDIVTTSSFSNQVGATWNYDGATFDADVQLYCDVNGANTFAYTRNGDQDIIAPQDAYYHLYASGTSGNKTITGNTAVRGDLLQFNNAVFVFNNTVTLDGVVAQTVNGSASNPTDFSFSSLTINNTSATPPMITFGSDVNSVAVSQVLTLTRGIVDIESTVTGNMTMPATGSVSGSNTRSFIDGTFVKTGNTAFEFPIGTDVYWAPIAITAPGTGSPSYSAKYFDAVYPDLTTDGTFAHVSGAEYWTLDRTGGPGNDVSVTLFWKNDTRSEITDLADLRVARYDGAQWVSEGQASNGGTLSPSGSVTSNTVSTFSPFTFASQNGNNPLPITLISFDAHQEQESIAVIWETSLEIDNDFFTLERSLDGINFQSIAQIQGKGNSDAHSSYLYNDYPPRPGIIYYKLTQTDFGGASETFDIISVMYHSEQRALVTYPNPAQDQKMTVRLPAGETGAVQLIMHSPEGRVVLNKKVMNPEREIPLDLSGVGKGTYILKVVSEMGIFQSTVVSH